jgi:hypothetical protein
MLGWFCLNFEGNNASYSYLCLTKTFDIEYQDQKALKFFSEVLFFCLAGLVTIMNE